MNIVQGSLINKICVIVYLNFHGNENFWESLERL